MPNYNIVLIGAGNVATQLGLALKKKHNIVQVFSKHKTPAYRLAKKLKCDFTTSLSEINPDADIYMVAVKDDAIADVAKQLKLKYKIIVHTSGSVGMESLMDCTKNYGVFYPLQTFSKIKKINFKTVPICLEANNKKTYEKIKSLANDISNNVQKVNTEQRTYLHIAAVFACNFTNHLYSIADTILKENKLSLELLQPLIAETANKIKKHSPASVQTGPAIRKDKITLEKHLKLIANKEYKKIYKMISEDIAS